MFKNNYVTTTHNLSWVISWVQRSSNAVYKRQWESMQCAFIKKNTCILCITQIIIFFAFLRCKTFQRLISSCVIRRQHLKNI